MHAPFVIFDEVKRTIPFAFVEKFLFSKCRVNFLEKSIKLKSRERFEI